MTVSSRINEAYGIEPPNQLVTPEFAPLAEFAGFREYEAVAVQETGGNIPALSERIARRISGYVMTRPEFTSLITGSYRGAINERIIRQWLDRTIAGPFDGDLAELVRELSHLSGREVTFPGVQVPMPPQLVLALTAWMQGEVLSALGETFDTATASAAGAAWMNQFMLQLGIMLEPCLTNPDRPLGQHGAGAFHSYAEFAGFGGKETAILGKTGPLLGPAAGGVITLAYDYLLSRPESAGYFQDTSHLAQRKMTLKGWWTKTTTTPKDATFHSYMSRVADAHVHGGGMHPHVVIPADLTIALMGWVQMRVMTALNTIALDPHGDYVFGETPEPGTLAEVGQAWMRMLTLQLGILLKPYLV